MSLNEALIDDLAGIGYDPSSYTAPKPVTAIPKGSYRVKLTRWAADTDRSTGALRNPYTLVASFEVVDGPFAGRFASFQRISSVLFKSRPGASMLNDLVAVLAKATNTEGAIKGREAVEQLLDLARDTNATFGARFDWSAYDKAYIANIRNEGRTPTNDDYNTARINGQAKFDENGNVVGASGDTLSAQAEVKGFSV
jgi:hypothetical protein